MPITRRMFLSSVASAAAAIRAGWAALPSQRKFENGNSKIGSSFRSSKTCGLVDLRERCVFRESVVGYRAALAASGIASGADEARPPFRSPILILPAVLAITPPFARALRAYLRAGGQVLLESGATFASVSESRAHQALLRDEFGIRAEPQVDLWRGDSGRRAAPYVDYDWPVPAKVRDFSRAMLVEAGPREVIGRVDIWPVALRRPMARGTLIFLGSPLGPALWAGDAAAHRWLGEIIARAQATPAARVRSA